MDQIAYIDLSKEGFTTKSIPEEIQRRYLGGRGLNAYLLYNHIGKDVDPISPDNVLVFGAGLLSGHLGISTARLHISAKSPETGIIGDSNCGGFWAPELRYAGFQHLVIKGRAEKPTYLWLHDGELEFRDASQLWGLDAFATQEKIREELGDPDVQNNRVEIPEGTLEAEVFDEKYKTGSLSCFACPIHCTHRYRIQSGPYAGLWGEGPEWYLMGGFGPTCGNVDNWEVILVANDLCNRYGLDIGSQLAYTAWLMELYQRGIIDERFSQGLPLEWGNKEVIIQLIHQIANREGLGDLLANGWREAANEIGKGCEHYMPHTKWLPMEQIDSRALRATALGEITSNRGHDHLRGRVNTEWMGLPEVFLEQMYGRPVASDPHAWEGKAWMATWSQYLYAVVDALAICKFPTKFFGPRHLGFEEFCESINAVTGWDMSKDELMEVGERIWNIERLFNVREGLGRDGDMPPEVYYEPNAVEPRKGLRTDPERYEKLLDEYYEIHGWDGNGRNYRLPESGPAPALGFKAFLEAVTEALRLTLSHPETIFEQISQQLESREREVAFLAVEFKEKNEKLSEMNRRLERLSRQHEMGILNDVELLARSSEVAQESQEMPERVHELERLLSAPAPWRLDGIASLVEEFRSAFHLPESSPASWLISAATAIAARWVDDLGMPGTSPPEKIWHRLAGRLNLRILIYPPQEAEVGGRPVKATLRIVGEFPPGATTQVVGADARAATATTLSSSRGQQRHP